MSGICLDEQKLQDWRETLRKEENQIVDLRDFVEVAIYGV
jgi:hypothetical protein